MLTVFLFFFAQQIKRNIASKQYSAPRRIIAAKPTSDPFLRRSRIDWLHYIFIWLPLPLKKRFFSNGFSQTLATLHKPQVVKLCPNEMFKRAGGRSFGPAMSGWHEYSNRLHDYKCSKYVCTGGIYTFALSEKLLSF